MPLPSWSFKFDHAQRRFSRVRIGVALAGPDLLDPVYSSNAFQDPVTKSTFLMPRCYEASWDTSNSGAYAKLGVADFGSPSGIKVQDQSGTGAKPYLFGAANITLQTTTTWGVNQGFVVSFLNYNNGAAAIALECGWSSGTAVSSDTAVRIYGDGFTEIWRGGSKIATGNLAGDGLFSAQNSTITVVLMPHRVRELLVWAKGNGNIQGGGIRGIMPDIDEYATSPAITPAAKFWIRQPALATNVMVAPLKFATSGHSVSALYQFGEAPDGSDVLEQFGNKAWAGGGLQNYRLYGDASYTTGATDAASCSLVGATGSAFSASGSNRDCRLKVALSGNGNSTPVIYGAEMAYKGLEAITDDSEEYDASGDVSAFSLSVPDGGGPVAQIEVCGADVSAGVSGLRAQSNRPFEIKCGTTTIINGRTGSPRYDRLSNANAEKIAFDVYSAIQALKNYRFRDKKPLDGMLVTHETDDCLVRFLLHQIGVQDSSMDLETSTVRIGEIAPAECGEWSEEIEVGATAWEVLERFMEDYLGGWFYDAVPSSSGYTFKIASPATLTGVASVKTLYWTKADAIAGGVADADVWRSVVRQMSIQVVESESNEVVVTGYDPRTKKAIGAVKRDYSSQDPALVPSLRPDNWHGEPRVVGVINKGISSQDVASGAVDVIAAKLFPARKVLEIESEFVLLNDTTGLPLWRGDNVEIEEVSYHVASLEMSALSNADGFEWRPTRYVLSNIVGATAGRTAAEIAALEARNRKDAAIQRRNSQGLSLVALRTMEVVT
jgi:hypothetical protein